MKKDEVNQRVIEAINYLLEKKIIHKKSELADKLDCSPQTITEILGGRQGANVNLLQKFFEIFDISYDFIFKGKGPILEEEKTSLVHKQYRSPYGKITDQEISVYAAPSSDFSPHQIIDQSVSICDFQNTTTIPMVDISAAAGSGYYNNEYWTENENIHLPQHLTKKGKTYLCVKIKGMSMVPTLQDGAYLIVRMLERYEWEQIRDGHVYIISDRDGRTFVKRIKNRLKQHGFIVCMSDNPDKMGFPNFNLSEEEINTIWYAEWYLTPKMQNIHDSYYNKVSVLEESYNELKEEIEKLRDRAPQGY